MTIIIRNATDAQARRAFQRVIDAFTGWTWYSSAAAENGVVSVDWLSAASWDRDEDLIQANQFDDEAPREAWDVTISTSYYTIATMLGCLTPAMRARAIMRGSGESADAYSNRVNAHNNA